MTDAVINYGTVVTRGGSPVGHCLVIEWPEIKSGKVEATAQDSGGVRQYIPDGLVGLEEFTLSLIPASGIIATLVADQKAGTISTWTLEDDTETASFSAFVISLQKEQADSQSPDVVKYTVTLAPTGGITFS